MEPGVWRRSFSSFFRLSAVVGNNLVSQQAVDIGRTLPSSRLVRSGWFHLSTAPNKVLDSGEIWLYSSRHSQVAIGPRRCKVEEGFWLINLEQFHIGMRSFSYLRFSYKNSTSPISSMSYRKSSNCSFRFQNLTFQWGILVPFSNENKIIIFIISVLRSYDNTVFLPSWF